MMYNRKIVVLVVVVFYCLSNFSSMGQDPDNLKEYVFVMLTKGPNRDQAEGDLNKIQVGHLQHIKEMSEKGILSIAGPFKEELDLRGILIFNSSDQEVVKKELESDPAVSSGRLNYKLYNIYSTPGNCLQ